MKYELNIVEAAPKKLLLSEELEIGLLQTSEIAAVNNSGGARGAPSWPEKFLLHGERATDGRGTIGSANCGGSQKIAELRQIRIASATPNADAHPFGSIIDFVSR
jgi:hypothetical protein